MSFERHPEATAALVSLDFAPLPTTVYANAEAELAQWTVTNLSKTLNTIDTRFGAQFYTISGAAGGYARRTISGLIPGRTYTFSMKYYGQSGVTNARGIWRLGVVGVGNGNSIDLKGTTTDRETAFTFVATAAFHTLQLTLVAHSAGETTSLFRNAGVALRGEKLPVSQGDMSLDKGRVPFGEAQVTVPLMSVGLLEKLNPFENPRVQLTATAENDPRVFDLVMTRRTVDHSARVVKMDLATDEALLQAYSKLTDDQGAFSRQDSLRSIVSYVLAQAVPGAALQTTGAADRPFRVLTDATNMVTDPRVTDMATYNPFNVSRTYDTSWPWAFNGQPVNGIHLYNPTAQDSYVEIGSGTQAMGMQAGRTYTASMDGSVRSVVGGADWERQRALVMHTYRPNVGYQIWISDKLPNVAGSSARVSVTFTIPADATQWFLRAYHGGSSGTITWAKPRVTETDRYAGTHNTDFFSGVGPNSPEYAYSWTGAADNSPSRRIALFSRAPEVLSWRAGRSAWDFLAGIIDVAGLRLWCDEQRRWWLVDPKDYKVPGRVSVRVDNATDGDDTMDAGGGDAPTGVVARFTWRDNDGNSKTKDDFAGSPGRVLVMEFDDRPYPGPGTAALVLVGMTNRGRTQEVTAASIMDATPGQEISISLPGTNDQLGQLQSVRWDLAEGLMDLRSSGLTEVTPGSWLQGYSERTWPNAPDTDTWASLT